VWLGLLGASVSGDQRLLIAWFGIRGIGSIYYLMFALNHGLSGPLADQAINITLAAVAASIILHGVSVTPLMTLYVRRQERRGRRVASGDRRDEPR
jgi:NhaP-type Na+/H+ or K+/H+ antiporter